MPRPSSRKKLRGVKIRFYESKEGGGNAMNICMCKAISTQHLGSRSMPPEEFLNFRHFQIAFVVHSQAGADLEFAERKG